MRRFSVIVCVCAAVLCIGNAASGATLYVGPNETHKTIQAGIDAATGGDVVIVRDGIYRGEGNTRIRFRGKAITVRSEHGAQECIIDCEGTFGSPNIGFMFTHQAEGPACVLDGFCIFGGYADSPVCAYGGAIYCSYASPTIRNCVFLENRAGQVGRGGAIYVDGGAPIIQNNVFVGNIAENGSGGAIYCTASYDMSPIIIGNTITANAANVNGGGIYVGGKCSPTITGNIISGNAARSSGGGLYFSSTSGTITDSTISHNSAPSGGGLNLASCQMSIVESTFSDNSAGTGAGIYCFGSSVLTISASTVTGNASSDKGGGIYMSGYSGSIQECVFNGNSAVNSGGGLHLNQASPKIEECTITGNSVSGYGSKGGGAYAAGNSVPVISGCVVAGNTSSYGGGLYLAGCGLWLLNSTIVMNRAQEYPYTVCGGGGIYIVDCFPPVIRNCIVCWNISRVTNSGKQLALTGSSIVYASYTLLNGAEGDRYFSSNAALILGDGMIDVHPLFADPDNGDFHLKSKAGRWNPAGNGGAGAWIIDAEHSPCIDAGHPISDYASEPTPNGQRINMGAYGNTAEASKSLAPQHVLTVRSTPVSGVSISGTRPGVTEYAVACDEGEAVSLSAPTPTTPQADPATSPVGGETDYDVLCNDGDAVQLSAPTTATLGDATFAFVRWSVNGELQERGVAQQQVLIDADKTVEAIYTLLGDSTGDCLVNILDLIFIRGRMGQSVATGDNWLADTNGDGLINILDLILVRGRLGNRCQ